MYNLSPTPEVQYFLALIHSGQTPSKAANEAGLNQHEQILIRKLAGLPVATHQRNIPDQVISLRSQKLTHKQIADKLSISPSYVNLCLVRHRKQSLGN